MLNVLVLSATLSGSGAGDSAMVTSADKAAEAPWLTTTRGISLVAPSPNLALGCEYGLSAWDHLADVGLEGQAFWFPLNNTALGLGVGGYLRLAPVPGDLGRRFYVHGKVNRTVAMGTPTFNSVGFGGGLGYRHPMTETPFGGPGYWHFETGLQRAFLYAYGENLFLVDALKTGLTF